MREQPSVGNLFRAFLRLGLTAFGGPAMVVYIKEAVIKRRQWLDEETFKDGVVLCQTIPGATVMQLAAYVGLRTRGIPGALASFTGFALPAFLFMLVLSSLYATYHSLAKVVSLFNGLQVVIVAIIAHATYTFGRTAFKNYRDAVLATAAAALLLAGINPFIVLIGAALVGALFMKSIANAVPLPLGKEAAMAEVKRVAVLVLVPVLCLLALFLLFPKLFSLAVLMMKVDAFAFGGGFASLPLMYHEIVTVRGWMDSKTFMDGIALGQVTPGPIVITSTFVGYILQGLTGALTASVAIFTPSFVMLVAITPVFDRLKASPYFSGATKGILISFVGLLCFVAIKFGMAVPWDSARLLLVITALFLLFGKTDILIVVLATATVSVFFF